MPAVCSAFGCSERRRKSTAVTFHRFPKDTTLQEKWISAIRRKNFKPGQGSYICSKHFKADDFDTNVQSSVRLLRGTVPSVFHGYPSNLERKVVQPKSLSAQSYIEPLSSANKNLLPKNELNFVLNEASSIVSVNTIHPASSFNPAPDNSTSVYVVDKSTPINNELKRELDIVSNKLETSLKKIKILQQSMRRLVKKNNGLKNIISEIRNKDMISDATHGIFGDLLKRKIAKNTGTPVKPSYSRQLRSFALTLHFYSPKAYSYVRRMFGTCLPHPCTLEKWYQSINQEPDFTEEAFTALQQEANIALQERKPSPCVLVMNESAGESIVIPPAAMSSSLLKSLLTLTETPSPKIILISGDFGSSYQLLVQQMVNQLLIQTPSCLYYVEASPFSRSSFCWSETAPVQHFVSTFKCYGEDECALDEALRHINTRPGQDLAAANLSHLDDNTGDSEHKLLRDSNTALGNERPVLLLEGLEAALLRTSARCLLASIRRAVQGCGIALLLCGSTDSLPPATLTALKHAVSASVHLAAIDNSGHQQWQGIARVQLQRPGGKLLSSCEYYKLSDGSVQTSPCNSDRLSFSYETTPVIPAVSSACCGATQTCGLGTGPEQKVNTPKIDDRDVDKILSSQTTFNLKLSDQERRDKNSLELPHHRARGAGLVHYTPDREDWDEDDPDDDLDI